MKKLFLLLFVCTSVLGINAQVFVENFATAPVNGNLEGYNNWYVCLKSGDNGGSSPKINEGALFYTGYAGTNVGNVAVLDSAIGITSANQRISTRIVKFGADTLKNNVVGQKIYAAFIANISSHSARTYRDFFTFEGSKTSSSTRGRVFAKINTAGDLFTIAISKNSSTAGVYVESTTIPGLSLSTGVNHLFVFCYENIEGTDNDRNILYIDPDLTKSEAEQTNVLISTDVATDYGTTAGLGINLRQRGIGALIGGIRVGYSWETVLLRNTGFNNISSSEIRIAGKTVITDNPGKIQIYNLAGSEVLNAPTNGRFETSLTKGLYLVKFVNNSGKTYSSKININ